MPSSLVSLQGQPIKFSAEIDDSCDCGHPPQCVLTVPGQQLYSQFQLQPCGTVTVCNNTLGAELILNGDFSNDLTDWTAGAGWTWVAGQACNDSTPTALSQTIAAGLVNGAAYLLTFDLTVDVAGSILLQLGANAYSPTFISSGSYSVIAISGAGTDIEFISGAAFEGCLDNVSLKLITSCWDADETDWVTSVDGACHATGNVTDITNTGTVVTVGLYYHITFTVSGSTAGGVTLRASSAFGAQTVGNGTFSRWGTADGAAVFFRPSSDFDGCISGLEIVQYNLNSVYHLLTADGDFVADISGSFNVIEDIVYLDVFNINNIVGDDYGCYKICLIDGCYGDLEQLESNIIDNGDFSAGDDFWTSDGVTFAFGKATMDFSAHPFLEQAIKTTSTLECMRIRLGFLTEGNGTLVVKVDGTTVYSNIVSGSGSIDVTVDDVPAGAVITIEWQGGNMDVDIDNVIINVPQECRTYDQCSPCIKYAAEFDCTKMVEGYCDGNAFRFAFDDSNGNNIFKISLRLKCELFNSTYNQEQSDYVFSTGVSSLNYASYEKIKTLFIQPVPEYKHDALALIKVCDHIFVDTIEYFSPKSEYTPEWNRTVLSDLAQSKIELKVKDATLFNTNCN